MWNIRTMAPGFSDDLQEVHDVRKTAVDTELSRLQMDILQESRLPATGSVRNVVCWLLNVPATCECISGTVCEGERDFTLFWQGKPSDEVREHSVGFTVRIRFIGVHNPTSRRNRTSPVTQCCTRTNT